MPISAEQAETLLGKKIAVKQVVHGSVEGYGVVPGAGIEPARRVSSGRF